MMTWSAPADLASAAFSSVDTVPITVAPRILAIWHSSKPTPPAAAWTRHTSPFSSGYVEVAR